jgi:hypothetical protein
MKVWILYYHQELTTTDVALHLTEGGALQRAIDWLCADYDNLVGGADPDLDATANELWSSRKDVPLSELRDSVKWFEKQLDDYRIYSIIHHEGVLP